MTKRKLTKRQDDIRRGLTTPQPYDGIHTCSKGCKKQGCNRGLRDTIEEQNAQIEGLKQDLLEKSAELRKSEEYNEALCERMQDLNNEVYGLQTQVAALIDDQTRLKAEVERLRKAGDALFHEWSSGDEKEARNFMKALVIWNAAKEGKDT